MKPPIPWIVACLALAAPILLATTKTIPTKTYASGDSANVLNGDPIQTGSGATVTAESGSYVTYQSGTSVTLNPGFQAQAGSYFNALINSSLVPSQPSDLISTSESGSYINLLWNPSNDSSTISYYRIYRNGALIGTSAVATYSDLAVTAGTTYVYSIVAVDSLGQQSAASHTVTATAQVTSSPSTVLTALDVSTGTPNDTANAMLFHVLRPQ